jgi:hypothetical protein
MKMAADWRSVVGKDRQTGMWAFGYCTCATNRLGLPAAEIARHLGVATASANRVVENLDKTGRL